MTNLIASKRKKFEKVIELYFLYNAILAGQAKGDENEIMEKINKICEENSFDKEHIINSIEFSLEHIDADKKDE